MHFWRTYFLYNWQLLKVKKEAKNLIRVLFKGETKNYIMYVSLF